MSTVLVIDTIQPLYYLAIYREGECLASIVGEKNSKTSIDIAEKIREILNTAKLKIGELTAVAATFCPILSTGGQIGQATAEALSFGLHVPFLKIDLFEAIKNERASDNEKDIMLVIKISERHFAWAREVGKKSHTNLLPVWKQDSYEKLMKELNNLNQSTDLFISEQTSVSLNSEISGNINANVYASDNVCTRYLYKRKK